MNRLSTEQMIEELVNQVEEMDLLTIIELAKQSERAYYETKTDEEIKAFYKEMQE